MWLLRKSYLTLTAINVASQPLKSINSQDFIWWIMTRRKFHQCHPSKRTKFESKASIDGETSAGVLLEDVRRLLANHKLSNPTDEKQTGENFSKPPTTTYNPPERFTEIELKISELSATGDGLALSSTADHVYVVPFTLPGDVVKARVVNYLAQDQYTLTDFIDVIAPSSKRKDSLIRCPYFSKCAGCQFQMLPYEDQLVHKKTIIEKAYRNFSSLTPDVTPLVGDTIGSPLQYGYRTKLTPHFDGPPGCLTRKARKASANGAERKIFEQVPPIGFMLKGTRKTIDIEDCPIGTDAVRLGMTRERKRITAEIASFRKGATILLRESTSRIPKARVHTSGDSSFAKKTSAEIKPDKVERVVEEDALAEAKLETDPIVEDRLSYVEEKTCITDSNAISTEYIDDFEFANPAGAFFQNNNSILPKFTAYIRDHILPPDPKGDAKPIRFLVDAYCGSGLFTITLSALFSSSIGIDIAGGSIASAKKNAVKNQVLNASFMTADASALFQEVTFAPDETVVVIDPPRKGCDDAFLQQLLRFGPRRVVYVSCNVHTQARDVGVLVEGAGDRRYEIESLQGFDFFPQTGHVEGVAVLNRSFKMSSI